jgi:hypothetical protein
LRNLNFAGEFSNNLPGKDGRFISKWLVFDFTPPKEEVKDKKILHKSLP